MGTLTVEPFATPADKLLTAWKGGTFVETGTYHGHTAMWAAQRFSTVHTVEINADFQAVAKANCAAHRNINFILGPSDKALAALAPTIKGPAVFWLDAHAGGGNFGDHDDCPLLGELAAIAKRNCLDDLIIIDDARAFVAPPPPPFEAAAWPAIHQVLHAGDPERKRHCVIIADMIIFAPPSSFKALNDYCCVLRPTI